MGGTPIGVGRSGHRSLGTSAFAGRVAGGGGPGGGGKGNNGGNGPSGTPERTRTVFAAFEWLKAHQSPDGSWDCDGFAANCTRGHCDGAGSAAHDVGVTGLALLAFLGAGETHLEGSYRRTVKDGLVWLLGVQDAEGCFGERVGQQFLYDHACATLALAEAYGMTGSKPLREPAQRAIRFVLQSQNPYSGWRYDSPPNGDDDTSVTGWMVMALKSAKLAGLTIDDEAVASALAWIDQMTDPTTGRTGYTDMGGRSSRLPASRSLPAGSDQSMTAVSVLARIFGNTRTGPAIDRGADLLRVTPALARPDGPHRLLLLYYGTLACSGRRRALAALERAIKTAIVDHQRTDPGECAFGSWDPIDPWSERRARVRDGAQLPVHGGVLPVSARVRGR
jgi:hypothetical protein